MKNRLYVGIFVALTALYVALTLSLPSDPKVLAQYQISQNEAHLLGLTIVVPFLLVFATALYGFIRFKTYADNIEESREGPAFHNLARGLMVLAFSLPITSIISSILNYVAIKNTDLLPTATIIRNYITLAFSIGLIMFIATGSQRLKGTLKSKKEKYSLHAHLLGIILLSSLFTWLITSRPIGSSGEATYYLPNWLVITTLAIPYLYIWCRGVVAVYHLSQYKNRVRGSVYKASLDYLAKGIITIIFLSIFGQFLGTLSVKLSRLNLSPLLLLVYLLVVLYAVGFGLVARGAKKLKQIEEV